MFKKYKNKMYGTENSIKTSEMSYFSAKQFKIN